MAIKQKNAAPCDTEMKFFTDFVVILKKSFIYKSKCTFSEYENLCSRHQHSTQQGQLM